MKFRWGPGGVQVKFRWGPGEGVGQVSGEVSGVGSLRCCRRSWREVFLSRSRNAKNKAGQEITSCR